MGEICTVLLAAGASRRMRGMDKLMQDIAGTPLLRRQALAAIAAGPPVFVTLPPDAPDRRRALAGLDVTLVPVGDPGEGMARSLKDGLAALPPDAEAALVILADMPELTAEDFRRVLKSFRANPEVAAVRGASVDGTPGHPVLFSRRLFAELAALSGDQGGRPVLERHAAETLLVPLPDRHALTDLDTPEDWAAWRRRQTSG